MWPINQDVIVDDSFMLNNLQTMALNYLAPLIRQLLVILTQQLPNNEPSV